MTLSCEWWNAAPLQWFKVLLIFTCSIITKPWKHLTNINGTFNRQLIPWQFWKKQINRMEIFGRATPSQGLSCVKVSTIRRLSDSEALELSRMQMCCHLRRGVVLSCQAHDDVIKWKPLPRHWPFVRGIHRSPVNSPHKGQWHGALMFALICVWTNVWVNNRKDGDLRYHCTQHYVIVMDLLNNLALIWMDSYIHTQSLNIIFHPCHTFGDAMMTSSNGNIFRVTGH